MEIEALNCPNCGAGVESNRSQCQFCKTRLKTIACPKCFGLMFEGAKFCDHCGAVAAPIVSMEEEAGNCPRCRKPLKEMQIGETNMQGCETCDGLWLDVDTFENICADREKQSAVLGFLDKRTVREQMLTKINYVPCPVCGELMNRNNFARASGVIVDICKQHGVWLDADELPKIVEFIQKGGMELARQREKNEILDERRHLRDEQRQQAMQDRRFGLGDVFEKQDNSHIRSFVRTLFE